MACGVLSAGKKIQMEIRPVRHQENLKYFPKAMLTNSRLTCLAFWMQENVSSDVHFLQMTAISQAGIYFLYLFISMFFTNKLTFPLRYFPSVSTVFYGGEDSFVRLKQILHRWVLCWEFSWLKCQQSANVWWTEGEILQCLWEMHFWTGIH